MTAAKEKPAVLGAARCPLCGGTAHVKLSGSGFAYLAMDCCKAQLFARGPESDQHLRDLIGTAPTKTRAPAPTPATAPVVLAEEVAPMTKPRTAPAQPPKPLPGVEVHTVSPPAVVKQAAARDTTGTLLSHWFK